MKTLTLKAICLVMVALMTLGTLNAQQKDRKLKKDLRSRVEKECRKTAKDLKKQGWEVMPGKLPIEKQIQESRFSEIDTNDDNEKLYFTASHTAVGGNYSAAKKMASSRAMVELAESINVEIASIVENNVSNMNFSADDVEVIDKCLAVSKQKVSARLNGTQQVLEIFRTTDKGTCEIRVMYRLNTDNAMSIAKQAYREELKSESEELAAQLDDMLK